MKSVLLTSALSLFVSLSIAAQTKPDFSGTWRMDPTRSESAMQGEPMGPVTVVITQTEADIRLETTTRRGSTSEVYPFAQIDRTAEPGKSLARWSGNRLMFDAVREVRGQSVTMQQSRWLSADGNEMTVESIVNVQHGYTLSGAKTYGAGKDVFVRVK